MIVIDKLCYYSKLRYVNASEKFIYAIVTLLFCVISRSIAVALLVLLANGILTVKKGGIPLSRYRKLLMIPLAFLFLSTLAIIVNFSKVPLDAFAIPIGSYYITGSWDSLAFAVQLILTALASVSCLYFLSLNTPMTDILLVLRKLRCPELIIELMMLIYRFIFVLMEISSAISTSQDSRLGNKDYKTSLKSFGSLASVLLIRAMKKSNALYDAMESRCYSGTIRVLDENYPPKGKEILSIVIFELFLLGVTIWRLYL
jgi:cobalt/nickel transport system permease protein